MKKTSKVLLLILCAVLLVAASVMGTIAYLTSQATVKNTFTYGKVAITMDEVKVDEYGNPLNASGNKVAFENAVRIPNDTDTAIGNVYKLIPGKTYPKDPTIHVSDDSENCFLFVKVVNNIADLEADSDKIAAQMTELGWSPLKVNGVEVPDTYYYKEVVGKGMNIPVFKQFKIDSDVKNADLDALRGNASIIIEVTAYAVQQAGFGSVEEAWNATYANAGYTG